MQEILHINVIYKCDVCGKEFNKTSTLQTLEMILELDRPDIWDVFSKGLISPGRLKMHKVKHITGYTPYKCDVCVQAFNLADGLKKHKMIHTSDTPYKCDICDKAVNLAGSLKNTK